MQDMLRKSVYVAVQLALCAGPAKSLVSQTGGDPVFADVRYLAADSLSGRGIGTPGLDAAAAYIARRFEAAGLRPAFDDYFQRFRLDPSAPALAHAGLDELDVKNVVGVVPGAGAGGGVERRGGATATAFGFATGGAGIATGGFGRGAALATAGAPGNVASTSS